MTRLSDFDVLAFDCYGTLIDWEAGITAALEPWLRNQGKDLDRETILEAFARHESPVQVEEPGLLYSRVLARVHGRLAREWGLESSDAEAEAFGASVGDWPAFPDSAEALGRLGERYRLVILSNVDHASFSGSAERLGIDFHRVLTAEDIGTYKPDLRNFRYLLDRLAEDGFSQDQILHTAESLYHDHQPALSLGFHTAWIHRRHGLTGSGATAKPTAEVEPTFRFESLAAMAEACEAE